MDITKTYTDVCNIYSIIYNSYKGVICDQSADWSEFGESYQMMMQQYHWHFINLYYWHPKSVTYYSEDSKTQTINWFNSE